MTDRVPGAPNQNKMTITPEEFAKLQKGLPAVVTITRDDKPITQGTPYSKEAVLPDLLAKDLCPGVPDPTPADAFSSLAKNRIVSQGTSGEWGWRKWADGTAECWCKHDYESVSLVPWGGVYSTESSAIVPLRYPFEFISDPVCNANILGVSGSSFWVFYDAAQYSTDLKNFTAPIGLARGSSVGSYGSVTIGYRAIGRWK